MRTATLCVAGTLMTTLAYAQAPKAATKRAKPPLLLSVAVLDFDCTAPDNPELGRQLAEIVSVTLAMDDRLVVVERARLKDLMQEQRLSLSGAVDRDKAAKIGKITGAKLIVSGKLFPLGKKLWVVCKIMSTETTQEKGFGTRFDLNVPEEEMIDKIAADLQANILKHGPKLIPAEESVTDRIAAIKAKLTRWQLPVVGVSIPEQHFGRAVPDPAAETEIKRILRLCGYELVDVAAKDVSAKGWPAGLRGVDILIRGEAFSELGGHIEGLISSGCRVELNAIERTTGKILIADRHSTSAVHLSEHLAAKAALQKAGHYLGYLLAERLAKEFGQPKPPRKAPGKPVKKGAQ